jgi:hypothetical protein
MAMDDKDRIGEARGAEDALRPERPGGERKTTGETDPRLDDRAAGQVEDPIHPGEPQAGDRNEQAALRGGPVDVTPDRPRKR